jgi:phospholipase/carboxylesterase
MPSITPLNGPVLMPRSGKPTSAVVMVHGYGSDGNDLIALAADFAEVLPETVFYAPNAPEPTSFGMGYQWFYISENYNPELMRRDPHVRAQTLETVLDGTDDVVASLNAYMDDILARHALTPDRLVMLGFSQGTMLALHVALRRKAQIAGVVGYSGALPAASRLRQEIASRPPVILIHGEADPVVPAFSSSDAAAILKSLNVPCELHLVSDVEHGIDDRGIALGAKFLRDKLG